MRPQNFIWYNTMRSTKSLTTSVTYILQLFSLKKEMIKLKECFSSILYLEFFNWFNHIFILTNASSSSSSSKKTNATIIMLFI